MSKRTSFAWLAYLAVFGLVTLFQAPLVLTWQSIGRVLAYQIPEPVMTAIAERGRLPAGKVYTTPHIGTLIPA